MDVWGIPMNGISIQPQPPLRPLNFHDHIPLEIQRKARDLFKTVDLDGNGLLSRQEITTMLRGLSSVANVDEDLKMWFKNADTD